jgi:hypothetical protein
MGANGSLALVFLDTRWRPFVHYENLAFGQVFIVLTTKSAVRIC